MITFKVIFIVIYFQLFSFDSSLASEITAQCDDWDVYTNAKCINVFVDNNDFKSYNDAQQLCSKNSNSKLISIHSEEENNFIVSLLRNKYNIVSNVWIGAQYHNNEFKWNDNSRVNYTNLVNGNVVANVWKYSCVEMSMSYDSYGKWSIGNCDHRNVVVCQRNHSGLYVYFQKQMMEMRSILETSQNELNRTKTELNETKNSLLNLQIREDISTQILDSIKFNLKTTINDFKGLEKNSMKTGQEIKSYAKLLENTVKELFKTQTELTKVSDMATESSPAGTIAYFTATTTPSGWLKADGQRVSRATYAKLFATIGTQFGSGNGYSTFNLPDLRGEFIRSWSDGRDGVDKDREFGSFQWGSSIPLAGRIDGSWTRSIANGFQDRWTFAGQSFDNGFERDVKSGATRDGITFPDDNVGKYVGYSDATAYGHITDWNVMKGTRPRNIAFLACIKY